MGFSLSQTLGLPSGDQAAAMQQALLQQQQQQYQQQVAEAERQRAQMAQDEAARQSRITGGISAIDRAFANFNPAFYQGAEKKYSDYYLPQIEQQATDARNSAIAKLFERGLGESSVGANLLGRLEKARLGERAKVGSEAADFSNSIQNQVNQQRNSLYDVARSAADPSQLAARATGLATSLAQAPNITTQRQSGLGDVFASMLDPLTSAYAGYQNRVGPRYPTGGYSPNVGSAVKIYG